MEQLKTGFNSLVSKFKPMAEPRVEFDEDGDNGMVLNNIFIPEELISRIFTYYMDANNLLNCQLVCKRWNMMITDYVWRKKLSSRMYHNFTSEDPYDWKDYCVMIRKLGKNLIKNHSGAEANRKKNWKILENGGHGWTTEKPPIGAPKLPEEPEFDECQHCFVTSFGDCKMIQIIDLLKEGFPEKMLDDQPAIEISEWYSCRWDCAAYYKLTVILTDWNNQPLDKFEFEDFLTNERQNIWFKAEHRFTNYGKGLRKIQFIHGGHDAQFWAGHYGPKMARASVKLNI